MCKIILLTNASKIVEFEAFAKYCADIMDQGDGYGHAIQGSNGVFGVRTTNPESYIFEKPLPEFVEASTEYFGVKSEIVGGALIHGRISTNSVSLVNTHPIERASWHLVHNGVVTDHGLKYSKNTSNDSEDVLHRMIEGGIESVSANLTGYYAFGAFAPNGDMHIVRDSIAPLFYAHSDTLDSDIFCTTSELVELVGDYFGETLVGHAVKNNVHLVYTNNKLIHCGYFKSRGFDLHSRKLSHLSLATTDYLEEGGYKDEEDYGVGYESWLQEKKAI